MREIKFRVWNSKKQTMENKSALAFRKNGVILYNYEQLMQYTGLKDKNGVEIYEGDILKGNYLRGIGVVEWNKSFCKFDISHRMNISPSDEFEVIGNIYENKELLA